MDLSFFKCISKIFIDYARPIMNCINLDRRDTIARGPYRRYLFRRTIARTILFVPTT